jgi:hypothetical protein
MIGVKMEATGPESIARTAYLRMALTEIELAALREAKSRTAQLMRLEDTPENRIYNDGVGDAMNVIGEMEAGR